MLFDNRHHAGRLLAEKLGPRQLVHPILLPLEPGGLEVGSEIARLLGWPILPPLAGAPPPGVTGRTAVIVSDGLESAEPLAEPLQVVRARNPQGIVVAIPVAPRAVVDQLERWGVEAIVLETPEPFLGVASYYRAFPALGAEDVARHLAYANPAETERIGE